MDEMKYAVIAWTAEDIKVLRPDWSTSQCNAWLLENERYIQDRLVELGWEVIEDLLPVYETTSRIPMSLLDATLEDALNDFIDKKE